ncbi:fimbrial protein [Edaphovirga cremea]|uniref:fimbrial protein n=1 Tax=Edaphovirga cremea TaxID=2267246 RepID=UPI00398A1716
MKSSNIAGRVHNRTKGQRMKRIKQAATGLLLLMTATHGAWAAVTCRPYSADVPRIDTVPLTPATISAGFDMPNGTILYQGRWSVGMSQPSQISCTTNLTQTEVMYYNYAFILQNAPLGISNWAGSPFGGAVYKTSVPGIGVAISWGNTSYGVTAGSPVFSVTNESVNVLPSVGVSTSITHVVRYVSLIKIGDLTPGSYNLLAADLPSFRMFFANPSNGPVVTGFPITTNIVQFQGQLNITTNTCKATDVNVDMGSHEKLTAFTGVGSTTPWKDASITLTDCPAFAGYYNNSNSVLLFDYSTGGGSSVPASKNNNVGVRLTPSTSVINSANGIMATDTSRPNSALGIGIQVGWGSVSGSPALFDFATEKLFQLPKDGRTEIKIPLAARYIQTDVMVTPGTADGKAVFLINYY